MGRAVWGPGQQRCGTIGGDLGTPPSWQQTRLLGVTVDVKMHFVRCGATSVGPQGLPLEPECSPPSHGLRQVGQGVGASMIESCMQFGSSPGMWR